MTSFEMQGGWNPVIGKALEAWTRNVTMEPPNRAITVINSFA